MHALTSTGFIVLLALAGFYLGRRRARGIAGIGVGGAARRLRMHSVPAYYGSLTALWTLMPGLAVIAAWSAIESPLLISAVVGGLPADLQALPADRLGLVIADIRNTAAGQGGSGDPVVGDAARRLAGLRQQGQWGAAALAVLVAVVGLSATVRRIRPDLRARNKVEGLMLRFMVVCSTIAVLTTVGIVLSLVFESIRFFEQVPLHAFLFGLDWSPQMAIRADQVGSSGAFGAVPLFAGTLLISAIALGVAVPIGLLAAIYMAEYAAPRFRAVVKPLLEILAGIPTVVYGFFAALTVAPFLRDAGAAFGVSISSESALAAGLVMGIMIIPFVSSLSDDVISAVPQSMREGSLGLGATPSETIRLVIVPAALPGIVGGVLLAASRAIGETMIVVMAAGLSANLSANPFDAVTTVTVQIVTLLVGDQEFDSPKTLAAFALGLVLFVVTLVLNIIALHVVRKYREQYE